MKDFIYDPNLVFYADLTKRDGSAFISDDASGHPCTVTGATWDIQGRTFAGAEYISCGNNSRLDVTGQITQIAWVKSTKAGDSVVTAKGDFAAAANTTFYWIVDTNSTHITINTLRGAAGATYTVTNATLITSRWLCAAYTLDPATDTAVIYVDGNTIGTTALFTATPSSEVADPLYIGALQNGAGLINPFSGLMGEIFIYNRVLPPLEVQNIYLKTKWRYQ